MLLNIEGKNTVSCALPRPWPVSPAVEMRSDETFSSPLSHRLLLLHEDQPMEHKWNSEITCTVCGINSCGPFALLPGVCLLSHGSILSLQPTITGQKHVHEVNWKLSIVCKRELNVKQSFVLLCVPVMSWQLVQGVTQPLSSGSWDKTRTFWLLGCNTGL